jgi:putative ABC transport system permease protein
MRFFDFIRFAIGGLWRQKIRTALTVLGVLVGASSLAFSLSLGVGLRKVVVHEFHSRPGFWDVTIHSGAAPVASQSAKPEVEVKLEPGLAPERAQRIHQLQLENAKQTASFQVIPISPEKLATIRGLADVERVNTIRHHPAVIRFAGKKASRVFTSTQCDQPELQQFIVSGRAPQETEDREVLVSEAMLFEMGLKTESEFEKMLGEQLIVELGTPSDERQLSLLRSLNTTISGSLNLAQGAALMKLLGELPKLLEVSTLTAEERDSIRNLLTPSQSKANNRPYGASESYTIVGIYRNATREDVLRPSWHSLSQAVFASATGGEGIFRRLHSLKTGDYDNAIAKLRPGSDLPKIVEQIDAMGLRTTSSLVWYNSARREVTAIAVGLNVFSWISLVIAALGITNTLVTNVVERTREIGILKAVGATQRQVLGIFLLEGTLIGTLGGTLGLLIARLASGPADSLVRNEIQKQMRGETMNSVILFEYPIWLSSLTIGSAAIVTTVAAIYPARRASRVNPIEALKAS